MLDRSLICTNTKEFSEARIITFLNPYSFLKISESGINLKNFDKVCIDGIALKLFLNFVFNRNIKIQRLSFDFTSVANIVFEQAEKKNQKGFILGSDEDSNKTFLSQISNMYPNICLDGHSGYFKSHGNLLNLLSTIDSSNYDFVVIGMGAVKQEEVAISLKDLGFQGRIYTCGGFIHQTALNGGEYYPSWVDRFNLRFAYRMFKEPSTIRRYLIDYPRAFFLLTRNIKNFS